MGRPKRRSGAGSRGVLLFAVGLIVACLLLSWLTVEVRPPPASARKPDRPSTPPVSAAADAAVDGALRVHFYDVAQGLAALVDLPGGHHVLVDTGDAPGRERCGTECSVAHRHLLGALARDLDGAAIDLLWVTHQHSDHIGGARDILAQFRVLEYVDNGRDTNKPEVAHTHEAARAHGTVVTTVDPSHPFTPRDPAVRAGPARVASILPAAWPADCATDPNECSLVLRIELGGSSVLFTGDAERGEERALASIGSVTLLQVGHHGSETSTTDGFLARLAPRYAVISAGHPGTGMNSEYCLPRAATLARITHALGPGTEKTLLGYAGEVACKRSHGAGWVPVPVSERLFATERDGDVVLVTRGDGLFEREGP
jgi:competence protein ComEC